MFLEACASPKGLGALVATMRPFSSVQSHVCFQVVLDSKRLGAAGPGADKGFHFGVGQCVFVESLLSSEFLVAQVARVGLFSSVYAHVHGQAVLLCKLPVAQVTWIGALPSM